MSKQLIVPPELQQKAYNTIAPHFYGNDVSDDLRWGLVKEYGPAVYNILKELRDHKVGYGKFLKILTVAGLNPKITFDETD